MKDMIGNRPCKARFAACAEGVAAVEFALLAPLLVLMLGVGVEVGRAFQAYREIDNAVVGVACQLASFPEYDARARTYAPYVAQTLLPNDWSGKFNLQVTSLQKDKSVMKTLFTDTLFGSDPGLPASSAISAGDFEQSEGVLYLAAGYDYVPLFGFLSAVKFRMTKTYAINPYFSRAYVFNNGQSADKYVN